MATTASRSPTAPSRTRSAARRPSPIPSTSTLSNGVAVYDNATTGNTIRFNSIRAQRRAGDRSGRRWGHTQPRQHGRLRSQQPGELPDHHVGRLRNDDHGRRFVRQSAQRHLHDRLLCDPVAKSVRLRRRQPLARLGLGDDGREWTGQSTDDVQPPGEHQPRPMDHGDGHRSGRRYVRILECVAAPHALVPGDRDPLHHLPDLRTVPDFHRDRRTVWLRPRHPDGNRFSSRSMAHHSVRRSRWSTVPPPASAPVPFRPVLTRSARSTRATRPTPPLPRRPRRRSPRRR